MVNGLFPLGTGPFDLRLKALDPVVELGDRIGIEILLRQFGDKVVLATRKSLVEVHRSHNVDPQGGDVNNGQAPLLERLDMLMGSN